MDLLDGNPGAAHDEHDHDKGLAHDLPRLVGRRRALAFLGAAGAAGVALLAGCGSDGDGPSAGTTSTTPTTGGASGSGQVGGDGEIPEETAGPFPADGSNGPDVLGESGVVRSDITSSFGSSTTVAEGIPLTMTLTVLEAGTGEPLAGSAVYLWHCDREGRYSMYSEGVEGENYLRGVQEAGADGKVTFTSIVPGCYSGRWPHAHFEVYPSLDAATAAGDRLATSQLALPQDVCEEAYATDGYEQSVTNLAQVSLDTDMVFSDDGAATQMAGVTGSASSGYTATLDVPV
jgi:protocatechuate 3,4-dioxygenase beta subunit